MWAAHLPVFNEIGQRSTAADLLFELGQADAPWVRYSNRSDLTRNYQIRGVLQLLFYKGYPEMHCSGCEDPETLFLGPPVPERGGAGPNVLYDLVEPLICGKFQPNCSNSVGTYSVQAHTHIANFLIDDISCQRHIFKDIWKGNLLWWISGSRRFVKCHFLRINSPMSLGENKRFSHFFNFFWPRTSIEIFFPSPGRNNSRYHKINQHVIIP